MVKEGCPSKVSLETDQFHRALLHCPIHTQLRWHKGDTQGKPQSTHCEIFEESPASPQVNLCPQDLAHFVPWSASGPFFPWQLLLLLIRFSYSPPGEMMASSKLLQRTWQNWFKKLTVYQLMATGSNSDPMSRQWVVPEEEKQGQKVLQQSLCSSLIPVFGHTLYLLLMKWWQQGWQHILCTTKSKILE